MQRPSTTPSHRPPSRRQRNACPHPRVASRSSGSDSASRMVSVVRAPPFEAEHEERLTLDAAFKHCATTEAGSVREPEDLTDAGERRYQQHCPATWGEDRRKVLQK